MRSDVVVVGDEAVDVALSCFLVSKSFWAATNFLSVWWNRSTLPQVWGWEGRECLAVMPRAKSSCSTTPSTPKWVRAVKMSRLSVRSEAGYPQVSADLCRTRTTSWALTTFMTREATHSLEWSSMMLRTSNTSPLGSGTWVMSASQRSLGRSATNRV